MQDKAGITFSKNTRKEAVKILMNIKSKAVKSSNGLGKIRRTMIFFKKSATQSLCSTVGSKINTGTQAGIAAKIVLHFLYLHCYKVVVGKLVCQRIIKDK